MSTLRCAHGSLLHHDSTLVHAGSTQRAAYLIIWGLPCCLMASIYQIVVLGLRGMAGLSGCHGCLQGIDWLLLAASCLMAAVE